MTTRDTDPPVAGFEPAVAHPARVYNVWLGGKDHFAPDREAAQKVAGCRPQVVAGARANRQFLRRVVRYLAGTRGVSQFLDIGTGLPAPDNTHELAQALNPAARVVYADNDPIVLAHARALLTSSPGGTCDHLDADLHDPAGILAGAARTLDLGRPAAVLLLAVLHFLPDADDPAGILAGLAAGLAPGSFVAVSHVTGDFAPAAVASGVAAYNEAVPGGITPRSHAEVSALLGGLSLVPPGVVPVSEWRPEASAVRQPADLYAALAATRPGPHQSRLQPAPGHLCAQITEPSGPAPTLAGGPPRLPPADPGAAADTGPDPDPEESLRRMVVLTGLLSAAGLTASLNVTRDIPDVTAWLPQPGGRDITVIVDDDGYIELRFWAVPGPAPATSPARSPARSGLSPRRQGRDRPCGGIRCGEAGAARAAREPAGRSGGSGPAPDPGPAAESPGDSGRSAPLAGLLTAGDDHMIEQAYDRDSVHQYVEAIRRVLGSDQLREATAAAAQPLPGPGDPQAKVSAALPAPGDAEPSSGGAVSTVVPYLSRDPTVSLVQSALDGALRDEGVADRAPQDRSLWASIVHTAEEILHPGNFSPDDPNWVIKIAQSMLGHLAKGNHPFNPRPAAHAISDSARLVVVGDWGTGLPRARAVASYMADEVADALAHGREAHVIHLGDVYYSGLPSEVQRHVLACWPVTAAQAQGGVTSWSLNGNHDMYSGGFGYFQTLLGDQRFAAQRSADGAATSFFRLTSPSWDFAALDTSWSEDVLFKGATGVLQDPQADFVAGIASASDRKLVLLSHHQLMSAYDQADLSRVLPDKLAPVLGSGRVTAWWWGHEHRCMGFEPGEGVPFARCLGHGGVPVLQPHAAGDTVPPPGAWEERGFLEDADGDHWARFGFAVLDLDGGQMQVRYRDDTGAQVRCEVIQ